MSWSSNDASHNRLPNLEGGIETLYKTQQSASILDKFCQYLQSRFLQPQVGRKVISTTVFEADRTRQFPFQNHRKRNAQSEIQYYDRRRINTIVNLVVALFIIVLLVLPIAIHTILAENQSPTLEVGVLLVFTLLFASAMSSLTKAKRHELLTASAAYYTELVVYFGHQEHFSNKLRVTI